MMTKSDMKKIISLVIFVLLFNSCPSPAENNDSLGHLAPVMPSESDYLETLPRFRPHIWQFATPTALVGLGTLGIVNQWVRYQNREIRDELAEVIKHKFTVDDFSQYAPATAVFALDAVGLEASDNMTDRLTILATSSLIMGATVNLLKYTIRELRPDGSSRNSFPSGHTAMAFMGAEFLFREYNDVSCWIGAAGFAVAAGTGFLRVYNRRHWLTDVLAGAGIGILSTKAAYRLFPKIHRWLLERKFGRNFVLLPNITSRGSEIFFQMSL